MTIQNKKIEITSNEQNKTCFCRNLIKKKCQGCGKESAFLNIKGKEYPITNQIYQEIVSILNSEKSGYEKKIALFDYLESIEIGDIKPEEDKKINYLLRSRMLTELAKKDYEKYQKATINEFSKNN